MFAAPELLGHAKLVKIHQALNRGVGLLSTVPIGVGVVLVISALTLRFVHFESGSPHLSMLVAGATMLGLTLAYAVGGRRLLAGLTKHLESDENLRRNFLVIGAILYFLGFVCQFTATFK